MATNTRPIKPSTDPNLVIERFQSGDAVDPNYGGTGLTNTELAGNVGKVLAVNATADGYTLTTGGGGGGGGVESVTGDSVDNTDPANPVVNAVPLSGTSSGIVTGAIEFQGNDGSELKKVYITGTDAFGGTFKLFGTDEGSFGLEFYNENSGVTTSVIFSSYDVIFNTSDGVNNSYLQISPTSINLYGSGLGPASLSNAAASVNTIFYSTTDGKLSYKDPGGTVNNLY